jgi:HSP20 family protein
MQNRSLTSTLDRMLTLNRAFDDVLSPSLGNGTARRFWVPSLDVVEKSDSYEVVAELPGVDQSQIDLSFEQNVLTIRGTKGASGEARSGEVRIYAAERIGGAFERTIRLPEFVDGERITAAFTNGLLTVSVPKAKSAQARKIEIGSGH